MHKFVILFLSILGASVFGTVNAQPVPSALVATTASATQINLTWINNGSNIGFQIERSLTSGSGFTLIATTAANVTSYANTGLTPGTTYFYRIRAVYGSSSYSAYTSEASATATNPIYVVPPNTLIATTVSTTQINLTWIVNGSNTGFQIERSFTSGSGFTLIATTAANVASYSNTSLTPSNIYFYRVRALYGSSYSSYTSEASATSLATGPPSAPNNLITTAVSSTQINLTWADNSTNETGFQIERSLTSGSGFTLVTTTAANATSYSNTSLTAGTKYFYRVHAINSAGNSAFTSEASATTLSPPVAPSQAHATTASSSSANVTWQDNSNNETGFQIERSITGGSGYALIATTAPNVITFTDTGLAPGTVYYYRIRAISSIGNSAYTNEASVLTSPAPPSQLVAQAQSSSTVKLTWANSNGQASFQIERSINGSSGYALIVTTAANAITFTDTGLAPVTVYYYRISAINASGGSSYTATVNAQTFTSSTPPAALSGLTAQVTSSSPITLNSFIRLTWTDNSANETGFEVYRWPGVTGSGMELISTTAANATSFVDERLSSEGTNYLYRVRSINTFGNSALSEILIYLPYFNNYNWIKETVVLQKGVLDETHVAIADGQKSVTWNYFDGLGRAMQTVSVASSPSGGDIVQPIIYDNYGRETIKYLPYKSAGSDGWYKTLPVGTNTTDYSSSPQAQFYQTGGLVAKDDNPYSATTFESSPLSRVLEQGAPGTAWQPDNTDSYSAPVDRSIKMAYLSNVANEVRLWKYARPTAASPLGIVTGTGTNPYYAANQLYKKSTKDEQWNEVIEYVDNQGRTVLKRVQVMSGIPTVDDSNYASTYYIYDDFGSLVCVVPPEASKSLTSTLKPFTWGSVTGLAVGSDNTLTKTAATGYANSGAYYATGLAASTSGWVRMIARETNTSRMIGFASSNAGTDTNIGFALELANNGHIYVWEDGTKKNDLGTYQAGTSVMISRENGYVKYYVDDVYKITSSKTTSTSLSTTALYVDVTINETGGTIMDVDISFSSEKSTLNNYAYFYTYDARHRMSQKQVPGAGPVYMVYDNRDRLVLTQDANQRAGVTGAIKYWTFTKYDQLNRPILTGIKDTTSVVQLTQADMQSVVDTYYSTASMTAKPWRKYGESFKGSSIANTINGYTNYSYPQTTSPGVLNVNSYLTATYYDNYTFRNDWLGTYTYLSDGLTATVSTGTYNQFATGSENQQVIGQVTGSKIKVLDGGVRGGYTWLKNINYYDDKYRVIQTLADNLKGGTDKVSNLYDFSGKLLTSKETHTEYDLTLSIGGASLIGNKLTALNGGWGNSGASSLQILPASQNGWVEVMATETTTPRAFGLSDVNPDLSYTSIKYSFMLMPSGVLNVIENNGAPTTISGGYKSGDILTIERAGSVINYKRNGTVVKTTTGALTTQLLVDIAINSQGSIFGTFAAFRSSFSTSNHSVTRRFIYDHANRLLEAWHQLDTQPEVRITYNQYNELGQLIDKKLHSTLTNATDNKQSLDYRYNIRGWLTSMNNSQLIDDHTTANTNDETGDLFGMNLLYEQSDASNLGSVGLYNGNISGMKWSFGNGQGDLKELGYNFSYDAMNRLSAANSKMNKTNSWQAGSFDENGLTYDLNGNIKSLQRKGDGNTIIDVLTYDYSAAGNQLQYVKDAAATPGVLKGFADGNAGTATDYTYDANGNLTRDLNKGIGTSLTDNTNIISYNFLNLPEKIVKGTDYVQYVYDATGRKLSQVVSGATSTFKNTDYVGEFTYENDMLKFINHEEGRIVMQKQSLIYLNDGSTLTGTTPNGGTTSLTTINGQTYINVAYTGSAQRSGVSNLGGIITVQAGESYLLRVKGYRNGNTPVIFGVRVNGSIDMGTGAALPYGQTAEGWIEKLVTIPTGGTTLNVGLIWVPVATGESFTINDIEISKISTTTPEYQYNMKDHLGNVRLTFTSAPETVSDVATLEAANSTTEKSKFLRYDNARLVNYYLFDHTNGSSPTTVNGAAQRLSGQTNEVYGLAKSIAVMPGDVINMEVYAKYIDKTSTNRTAALNTLISQIATGTATAGTVVDGGTYTTSTSSFPFPGGPNGTGNSTGTGPKAYLNWLTFDKNNNLILSKSGYSRLTTTARETGLDVTHEKLTGSITISDPGYVYIYYSNEEGASAYEVYFDDFKVTQVKSSVIATSDYYPFGLTFNSYSRESSVKQDHLYNGKELQDELNLGWLDYGAREYMPEVGRFNRLDIFSSLSEPYSPYGYAENDPVSSSDLGGNFKFPADFRQEFPRVTAYLEKILPLLQNNSRIVNSINKHTNLDKNQIIKDFQNGSGPELNHPQGMSMLEGDTPPHWGNNYVSGRIDLNGGELLSILEDQLTRNDPNEAEMTDIYKFMSLVVILHEYVHSASKRTNYKLPRGLGGHEHDEGSNWEYEMFGRFIDFATRAQATSFNTDKSTPQYRMHNSAQSLMDSDPSMGGMFMVIYSPTSSESKKKKRDDDKEASKRSGGG